MQFSRWAACFLPQGLTIDIHAAFTSSSGGLLQPLGMRCAGLGSPVPSAFPGLASSQMVGRYCCRPQTCRMVAPAICPIYWQLAPHPCNWVPEVEVVLSTVG